MSAAWVVMPVVNNEEMTVRAVADCLDQQGVDVKVLVVLQGAVDFRESLEQWAEREPRLLVWSHNPPLPSLSATWNRALKFVWECGGEECLVINNDTRIRRNTYALLRTILDQTCALFVTAVGVRQTEYEASLLHESIDLVGDLTHLGGPDFSCFLISREAHQKYGFDEAFVPAYREDCCYHREMMLGEDGHRIFSVNLPYLHYASGTLSNYTAEERERFAQRSQASKAHYLRCWGGDVNHERFTRKGDPTSARDGVTNPELQARIQAGARTLPEILGDVPLRGAACSATVDSQAPD